MNDSLTYTQKKKLEEQLRKKQSIFYYGKYIFLAILFVSFCSLGWILFSIFSSGDYIPEDSQGSTSGVITQRKSTVDYSSIILTRGELVSILILYLGVDISKQSGDCFRDIENSEYKQHICYAVEKDWIQGRDDGLFYPNDIINHAQGLKLILNFLGENVPQKAYENTFKDIDRSFWYATYAEYAKRKGIIAKHVEYFSPEESISLEQVDTYVRQISRIQNK